MNGILRLLLLLLSFLVFSEAALSDLSDTFRDFVSTKNYTYATKGQLLCGPKATTPRETKLKFVDDKFFGPDTVLQDVRPVNRRGGHFRIRAKITKKVFSPKPTLLILTKCNNPRANDNNNCYREVKVNLPPEDYANTERVFNLGKVNLETTFVGEKTWCPDADGQGLGNGQGRGDDDDDQGRGNDQGRLSGKKRPRDDGSRRNKRGRDDDD